MHLYDPPCAANLTCITLSLLCRNFLFITIPLHQTILAPFVLLPVRGAHHFFCGNSAPWPHNPPPGRGPHPAFRPSASRRPQRQTFLQQAGRRDRLPFRRPPGDARRPPCRHPARDRLSLLVLLAAVFLGTAGLVVALGPVPRLCSKQMAETESSRSRWKPLAT